jgi:GTP-binding protein EngB required for normal cell division
MPDNRDKDRIIPLIDQINKRDLEIILEVNRKAVEIETAVADQNEEIIRLLNDNQESHEIIEKKLDKLIDSADETSKDLFKIQVLFVSGLLALVAQIIQIFLKK